MQAFMTCHDDLHFYTLTLSNFESYFCKWNICIKGLVLLWNYINTLILPLYPKFLHTSTYIFQLKLLDKYIFYKA
jgi:hypothetical protein